MSDPRPEEFRRFHELLMKKAPEGYDPYYFRVEAGSKAPAIEYGSWKDENNRLTVDEAIDWMEGGGNVGIAGTDGDRLVNVDIDDEDATTPDDIKPTLVARSRSRTGVHAWYFAETPDSVPNIPTDDAGEVRTAWQYVVAPGSYVDTDPEDVPAEHRDEAGYYTIERAHAATKITMAELPDVFTETHLRNKKLKEEAEDRREEFDPSAAGGSSRSALFDIEARDVVQKEGGSTSTGDRWSSIFHGSDTDANMTLTSKGLLQCFRHNCTHNGLQALVVLSGYFGGGDAGCEKVGSPHTHSGGSPSAMVGDDGAIWSAWRYAKSNGYLPADDPVPYRALIHLCREMEITPPEEIPETYDPENGQRLPSYAYNAALAAIENKYNLDPGRDRLEFGGKKAELDIIRNPETDEKAAEADGGVETAVAEDTVTPSETDTPNTPSRDKDRDEEFKDDVHSAIAASLDEDGITRETARHRIALSFTYHYNFVYPERDVRGWRETLYVYNESQGVYEPRGEAFVQKVGERVCGDFFTNQTKNEIVEKVKRLAIERGERFKTPPNRLVVGNGILDLHTGELDDWTPDEYHQTKLDVDWNPDAGEPEAIDEFFCDIVEPGDVNTLYRIVAHTVYKKYAAQKAAMLIGDGQNGKSVFLKLIEAFLSEQNVSRRALQDFNNNSFAANSLAGKLANIHPDMGDDSVTDMSTFKKLTGEDKMDADVKFESPITFENFATIIFAANEMPVFSEDNHAVWRRWVYVNFPYTFDNNDPNAKDSVPRRILMRELTDERELEALLVRCQKEIQAWHEGREWFPEAMRPEDVREQMKKAAEPVFNFAMTCLREVDGEDAYLLKKDVRQCYRDYATEEGLPKLTAESFGEKLVNLQDFSIEASQKRIDGGRPRVYKGVGWTERGRQVLGLDEPAADNPQSTVDTPAAKPAVLETLRELVEEAGNEPVSEDMVIGAAMSKMSMSRAQHALNELKKQGSVLEQNGKVIDT